MNMTLPDAAQIKGKGTIIRAAFAFVESQWGPEGRDRLVSALSPEARTICSGMILTGSWYPLPVLVEVYETIDKLYGSGDLRLCRNIGRFSADFEIKLLHKVFLKIAKIDYWFKMASASWRMYYSAGRLDLITREKGGLLTISEFNPISKAFCYRFTGWLEQTVTMSGHANVVMKKTGCVLDGDASCSWDGDWSK